MRTLLENANINIYFVFFVVGGIYTVIRTKAASTVEELGDNYVLIGPLNEVCMRTEVDVIEPAYEPLKKALQKLRDHDVKVQLLIYKLNHHNLRLYLVGGLSMDIRTAYYSTSALLPGELILGKKNFGTAVTLEFLFMIVNATIL